MKSPAKSEAPTRSEFSALDATLTIVCFPAQKRGARYQVLAAINALWSPTEIANENVAAKKDEASCWAFLDVLIESKKRKLE